MVDQFDLRIPTEDTCNLGSSRRPLLHDAANRFSSIGNFDVDRWAITRKSVALLKAVTRRAKNEVASS